MFDTLCGLPDRLDCRIVVGGPGLNDKLNPHRRLTILDKLQFMGEPGLFPLFMVAGRTIGFYSGSRLPVCPTAHRERTHQDNSQERQ